MKNLAAGCALILAGCGAVPWMQGPDVGVATCTASCNAHFDQCPKIFAGFPERGAVECPAEHNNCLKACAAPHPTAHPSAMPAATSVEVPAVGGPSPSPPVTTAGPHPQSSKEAKLRELKHLHDEGLVTEDVYKDRQKEILLEP